ncbi:MAG: glycosyltransferase family 39 protein [Verrucomicrobia bacterium]|nr:glycosyltransferase family 39 protein [Verrucomicrobiota bacterium]
MAQRVFTSFGGFALVGIALVLLFHRLGVEDLGSADEAVHGQVAREMARDGHWLYPTYRGEPYFEKPPLKFWLTAVTFRVAGESEFTARLWSALFALGAVWGVARLGAVMFNRKVGWAAGLVLVTTWEFLFDHCARTGELDSALLCFMTFSVEALWRFRGTGDPRFLRHAAVSLALGFLIKGHLALLPLLWLPWVWRVPIAPGNVRQPIRARHIAVSLLIFFGIAAPWFLFQWRHYGNLFWAYMIRHNLTGYAMGKVENADTSIWYYVDRMVSLDYPWPPLMILGGLFWFQRDRTGDFPRIHAARAWLLAWLGTTILVLACSKTKLPWYHLPAMIPLALMAGFAVERCLRAAGDERMRRWNWFWLVLHVGLFFFVRGFAHCARGCLAAWIEQDRATLANYAYHFFENPGQRSVVVALAMLFAMILGGGVVFGARIVRRRSCLAKASFWRTQCGLCLGLAVGFAWLETWKPQVSEGARETVQQMLMRGRSQDGIVTVHLFDGFRAHAPHYSLSPSLYYYLASSPQTRLHHHPTDETEWRRFAATMNEPCLAVIPSAWKIAAENERFAAIGKTGQARWIYIGTARPFPNGAAGKGGNPSR